MEDSSQRWMVKDKRGRIFGPFSTERLFGLIKRTAFTGEELLAIYPDGEFRDISKTPQFYDLLLETLAKENRLMSEQERQIELTKSQQLVKNEIPPEEPRVNRAVREQKISVMPPQQPDNHSSIPPLTKRESVSAKQETIELQPKEKFKLESEDKRKIFIAVAVLFVGALIYILLDDGPLGSAPPSGQIELIYPRQKQEPVSEADAKKQLALALQMFQQDSFSSYFRVMNIVVGLLESGYANVDAMSLLCLSYRELWPYANQDSKDITALSKMAQISSQKDPVGLSSATCKVVQLLLGGQADGAASLTDSTLNEHPAAPAFYEFKASMLASRGETLTAIGYLEKAQQLWPKWLKILQQKAELLTKDNRQSEAAQVYNDILKQNSNHPAAQINLGELEYFVFKHLQNGIDLVKAGLEADRLPRGLASRGYLLLAVQYQRDHKTSDAVSAANKAFSLDPTNLSAKEILRQLGAEEKIDENASDRELVALGEEYLKKGNNFAAQAQFKTAFEINPQNARAAFLAAQSLWELNQSVEAIEWAKKAVQADKTLVGAHVLLADYYSQKYNFKMANQMLQAVHKIAPKSYQVLSGFALIELRRFNYKGAIEMARRALKLYDTDIETLTILAAAYLGARESAGAYETILKAITLDANNRKTQSVYTEILAEYKGVDEAVEYLKNRINTYPQRGEYKIMLAKIFIKDDRIAPAIEVLDQALALNDKNKEALILMGTAQEKAGDNRAALKAYLSAATLDPADVHPSFLAGELYIKINDLKKAVEQFQQVVRINQMYPRAHYQLGKTALLMGEPDIAFQESVLEKRINPSLTDGYILAGDVYMAKRDYAKAAAEYQRAVSIQPQTSLYISLARAYRLLENYNVASSLLAKVKADTGNPDLYKEQGAVFEGRGEKSEAVLAYQKYLMLLPSAPDREVIKSRIKGLGGP